MFQLYIILKSEYLHFKQYFNSIHYLLVIIDNE